MKLPSSAIAELNHLVQEVMRKPKKKSGQYNAHIPTLSSKIGKYSHQDGVASSAQVFTRMLEKTVSETTVCNQSEMRTGKSYRKRGAVLAIVKCEFCH